MRVIQVKGYDVYMFTEHLLKDQVTGHLALKLHKIYYMTLQQDNKLNVYANR